MCGILGVHYLEDLNKERFMNSLELLTHRGPDHQGYYLDEENKLAIGHTRLSIIDLDPRSNQPMQSEKTGNLLSYNGEIFNFKELRDELILGGVEFVTSSDSEVFLKSYEYWGLEFVDKLNGFFAAAIFDRSQNKLILIRDRFGIKPLYYYNHNNEFIYSSEIKPILNYIKSYELDERQLEYYFSYRYNISTNTLFKGIKQVPLGSFLTFESKKISIQKFWSATSKINFSKNKDIQQEEFNLAFRNAVSLRLNSDKNVGVYLSGGIDSNAIATELKSLGSEVKTFSIGFGEQYDETKEIKKAAEFYGYDSSFFNMSEINLKEYHRAQLFLEEPIGDSIVLPTMKLAELSSSEVSVVMSGEGADEVLNGYVHHVSLFKEEAIRRVLPKSIFNLFCKLFTLMPVWFLNLIFPYPAKLGKSGINKLKVHFSVLENRFLQIDSLINLFFGDEFKKYFSKKIKINNDHLLENFLNTHKDKTLEESLTLMDLEFWNSNYTLKRLDRLNMSHSVEARVPFLDHKFAEICLRLPLSSKLIGGVTKFILRKSVAKNNNSREIVERPKKPFYFPVYELARDEFMLLLDEYFTYENLKSYNFFNIENIIKLKNKNKLELLEEKRIFVILSFLIWHRIYFSEISIIDEYREYRPCSSRALWSDKPVMV